MQQVTAQTRQARAAVTALFFTNGALMAGMVPRYPAIKDVFELSGSTYGLTVALFPLGGMCGGSHYCLGNSQMGLGAGCCLRNRHFRGPVRSSRVLSVI